jgi:rhodanese-related sulfurtransferase
MDRFLEFTGNHTVLVVALTISFFVLILSELRRKASGLFNVDSSDAVALINNDAIVVDLRNAEAFSRGHIVNSKNIPLDQFEARRDAVLGSKSKKVIAVCDSGISSKKVAGSLRKSGFESAYSLKGGINAWTQAGLPVVSGKKTKSKR